MSFSEISRRWKTEKAYTRQQAEDMPYNENKPEIQKYYKN